jgi:hypothetical protein
MVLKFSDNKNKFIEKDIVNLQRFIFDPIKLPLWDDKFHYQEKYYKEFNSNFFRCEEFKKIHSGQHILFMGCSETQGCNSSLEETWSYILYKKISEKEKTSGYFNISKIGSSISLQISIFLKYIESFGVPDQIYFLTPGTDRDIIYSDGQIDHQTFFLNGIESKEKIINSFIHSITYLNMFEKICENLGVKMIWSTWHDNEEEIFLKLPFKNFFSINMNNSLEIISNKIYKYFDNDKNVSENLFKSDGHRGQAFHRYWAQEFYDKIYNK